eukprot:123679_1
MATANKVQPFNKFKESVKSFLTDVKETARNQLHLFKLIKDKSIKITDTSGYETHVKMHFRNLDKKKKHIKPTLEMQLLWIVHALNPKQYFNSCHKVFNQLIPVELADNIHAGYCPDDDTYSKNFGEQGEHKIPAMDPLIEKLDLKQAVTRQLKFINKINNIQKYQEISETQIDAAISRYYKFLYLMSKDSKKIIVPTLGIDLIWHSHQLNAISYHKMSKFMFPEISVIDHNDNIDENLLKKYRQETESRWNELFGENDYLKGMVFGVIQKETDTSKKNVQSKKRKLDVDEQMSVNNATNPEQSVERPNKRRKILHNNNNEEQEIDDMSSEELKKRLKKEIEKRKKMQEKWGKFKVENAQLKNENARLTEENSELESKLEQCECGA